MTDELPIETQEPGTRRNRYKWVENGDELGVNESIKANHTV